MLNVCNPMARSQIVRPVTPAQAAYRQKISDRAHQYAARIAAGKCRSCDENRVTASHCAEHAALHCAQQRVYQKAMRERNRAARLAGIPAAPTADQKSGYLAWLRAQARTADRYEAPAPAPCLDFVV